MTLSLFKYQEEAISKLRTGSILCGGVGSGKSITSLYYYFVVECQGQIVPEFSEMKKPKKLFIITTARKRDTLEWEKEYRHFRLMDVVVDSWNNIHKYIGVENAFFIFDEQRVVGSGTWVKSFVKITKVNNWILLSATPGDTWMDYVPVFVANGYYKNRTEFIRKHVIFDRFVKYPKVKRYVDTNILLKYKHDTLVTMDYKKKNIQHHKYILVNFNVEAYEYTSKQRFNMYTNKPIETISELCYVWRKIVNSDDTRLLAVKDIFKTNKKMIVFYNFDYELEALKQFCEVEGILYKQWNGHKHENVPTTNEWLYLVQYTAGAEGWNCISTNCILFYSMNYSYKIVHQAAGRIDRLNSPYKDLYYYHLYSKSKIDLAILNSLKNKKTFNEKKFIPF